MKRNEDEDEIIIVGGGCYPPPTREERKHMVRDPSNFYGWSYPAGSEENKLGPLGIVMTVISICILITLAILFFRFVS